MSTNEGQYKFEVREDGKKIAGREIDDPFIVSTIGFHLGRWDAFKAIFRPLHKEYQVRVSGTTDAAYRVVFGGDYELPEAGPPVAMLLENGEAREEAE